MNRAALVAQERIPFPALVLVRGMDRGQRVPLHPVAAQRGQPVHHLAELPLLALFTR